MQSASGLSGPDLRKVLGMTNRIRFQPAHDMAMSSDQRHTRETLSDACFRCDGYW